MDERREEIKRLLDRLENPNDPPTQEGQEQLGGQEEEWKKYFSWPPPPRPPRREKRVRRYTAPEGVKSLHEFM